MKNLFLFCDPPSSLFKYGNGKKIKIVGFPQLQMVILKEFSEAKVILVLLSIYQIYDIVYILDYLSFYHSCLY